MRYFKTIVLAIFLLAGVTSISAQETQEKVVKVAMDKVPEKVKNTLKNYSGYTLKEEVTYTKKRGSKTVYAFKVQRKNSAYTLLIDKKGKVVGIREGEREN